MLSGIIDTSKLEKLLESSWRDQLGKNNASSLPLETTPPEKSGDIFEGLLGAVSGYDESWKLMSRRYFEIFDYKYSIKFDSMIGSPLKYPISIVYHIKNKKVQNHASTYLIQDGTNAYTEKTVENDKNIKINLIFHTDKRQCVEEIYFHHGR